MTRDPARVRAARRAYEERYRTFHRPPLTWLGHGGFWMLVDDTALQYERLMFVRQLPEPPACPHPKEPMMWRVRPPGETA